MDDPVNLSLMKHRGVNTRNTGREGEDLATQFLQEKGYAIKERNYRYKRCEIDIIAMKDQKLVFVEVKSRGSNTFGYPESFVDEKQAERIMEAADEYIYQCGWQKGVRFDIISIETGKEPEITHFKDAFY